MALLTGKDFSFTGLTGLRCSGFQISTSGPVYDATRPSDTVTRYKLGDSTASGRVVAVMTRDSSGDTIIVKGGSYAVTYTTDSDKSYTDTIIVTRATYDPSLRPGQDAGQAIEIEFVIQTTGGILG